jgi:F-type H+-transporting ATPase subunit a
MFLFARLARTYSKTVELHWVVEFFEPVVLFIRDEIAIPNIGKAIHELFVDSFLCVILKYFWVDAFGINVTGNLTSLR